MQNVFIINLSSLYEILDEIKENLSFKIIKFDNVDDFINKSDLDIINSLIISKPDAKLIAYKNVTDRNFLNFEDCPLSLNKLIELINIKLIKLKFNHQSKINIKGYELNINSKFFSKNNFFKAYKPFGVELSPSFLLEFRPFFPMQHLNLKSSIIRVFLFFT